VKLEFTSDSFESEQEHGFLDRVAALAEDCNYNSTSDYGLEVGIADGRVFIQVLCERPDTYTGEYGTGRGGRRFLDPAQTDSSIVRSIFAAFIAYNEHETREAFTYQNARIFGPHIDVGALVEIASRIEKR
jgi:hypothetical protein